MKNIQQIIDERLTKYDDYIPCSKCEKLVHEDELITFGDGIFKFDQYCEDCADEIEYCSECENYGFPEDMYLTEENAFCDEDCYMEYREMNESVGTE